MVHLPPKICIFCFGNAARGDDAVGERMHELLHPLLDATPNLQLLLDFQLAPEHIYDLRQADIGIFIDAHHDANTGVTWQPLAAGSQVHFSTHHLPPESLLYLYQTTFNCTPPPSYLLTIAGERFELEEELSALARSNLQQAYGLLQEKLAQLSGD